jgi:hypothetical protein
MTDSDHPTESGKNEAIENLDITNEELFGITENNNEVCLPLYNPYNKADTNNYKDYLNSSYNLG